MPIYKALILNKEISLNYELDQKDKLEEAIKAVNLKIKDYDGLKGKIGDVTLLSFLAIKLQAEIFENNTMKINEKKFENKIRNTNNENITLANQLYELSEKNKLLEKENKLINEDVIEIKSQINIIINLIKKTYEEK